MYKTIIKRLQIKIALMLLPIGCPLSTAGADYWNLPLEISPANTSISFEVDSTWHLVEGTARDVSGKLWLGDAGNFKSLQGAIKLPVSSFFTGSESRDERMREVMNAVQSPLVTFTLAQFEVGSCDPERMAGGSSCTASLAGDLTINSMTKRVILDLVIKKDQETFEVTGTTLIMWPDFQIEDPSILIARLDPNVKITVHVLLAPRG